MPLSFRTSRPHHRPVFANASQVCAGSKFFSDDTEIAPATGRKKKRRSGTETPPPRAVNQSVPLVRIHCSRAGRHETPGPNARGPQVSSHHAVLEPLDFQYRMNFDPVHLRHKFASGWLFEPVLLVLHITKWRTLALAFASPPM